jgi:hypothetical protein
VAVLVNGWAPFDVQMCGVALQLKWTVLPMWLWRTLLNPRYLLAVSLSSNAESLKEKLHADNINSFDYDKMKTVSPPMF